MTGKMKIISLGSLMLILALLVFLNYSGLLENLLERQQVGKRQGQLAIDFLTLQGTINAVSSSDIPAMQFIHALDTLAQKDDLKKLRNPFKRIKRKVIIPKAKKQITSTRKKTAYKPRKKKIRRPKITVDGIVWDRSKPFAILDGEIFGEGDFVKGYYIQTIVDTMIVLSNDDDIFSINYIRD